MKISKNNLSDYLNLKMLLLVGMVTHILSTIGVLIIGRTGKFPQLFNESGAMWKDAILYHERCAELAQRMGSGDFAFLFSRIEQIHIKIYTIFYFIFSPIFGGNILAFEPLNLTLFGLTLFFIYKIGEVCFDAKTGLLTAFLINFFPTFLLHSTQPLRDPLFIPTFLAITYCLILLLKQEFPFKKLAFSLLGCYALFVFVWLIRDSAFPVYAVMIVSALFFFILKHFKEIRQNLMKIFLFAGFAGLILMIPIAYRTFTPQKTKYTPEQIAQIQAFRKELQAENLPRNLIRINLIRQDFIAQQPDSGSAIDSDKVFRSYSEVLFYLPRAALIGFFAPFPNMWVSEGKSFGKIGRIISAGETLLLYLLSLVAVLTIYYSYKSIEFWQLVLTITAGIIPLGFFVTNVGALYRIRYVFWFLLMIIGAKGFFIAFELISNKFRKEKECSND